MNSIMQCLFRTPLWQEMCLIGALIQDDLSQLIIKAFISLTDNLVAHITLEGMKKWFEDNTEMKIARTAIFEDAHEFLVNFLNLLEHRCKNYEQNFQSRLRKIVQFTGCGQKQRETETFKILSLGLVARNLDRCLEYFLKNSRISYCDNCVGNKTKSIDGEFCEMPNILIIPVTRQDFQE